MSTSVTTTCNIGRSDTRKHPMFLRVKLLDVCVTTINRMKEHTKNQNLLLNYTTFKIYFALFIVIHHNTCDD